MTIHQHGLNRSIILHLREKFPDAQVDLIFDGYKKPDKRPLITVEPMQANNTVLVKGREAVEYIYRFQIGLFDINSVQLSINQERLQSIFNFDRFVFYDTLKQPVEATGYFYCDLTAVTPMLNDDLTNQGDNHRVYFDIEIQTEKYKEAK